LVLVTGCGKKEEAPKKAPKREMAKAPEVKKKAPPTGVKPTDPNAIKDDGKVVTVALGATDLMKYSFTRIDVAAGRKVKLTLTHTGKMPIAAMGHNFVLLKKGVDALAFANKAVTARKTEYIPEANKGDIIAHTKLVGGGSADTIEFDAPEAGTYSFVCTFPGHAAMMKGILVVK
jgi:azurin